MASYILLFLAIKQACSSHDYRAKFSVYRDTISQARSIVCRPRQEITTYLHCKHNSCNDASLLLNFEWVEKWTLEDDAAYRRKMLFEDSKDTQLQIKPTFYIVSKIGWRSPVMSMTKCEEVIILGRSELRLPLYGALVKTRLKHRLTMKWVTSICYSTVWSKIGTDADPILVDMVIGTPHKLDDEKEED